MDLEMNNPAPVDTAAAKKRFSRLGLGAFLMLLITMVVSSVIGAVVAVVKPELMDNKIFYLLLSFVPLYAVGVPIGILVIRKVPREAPERESMPLGRWIVTAIICIFLMYAGNLIGIWVTSYLESAFGITSTNPLEQLITGETLLPQILVTVILAPILEELIFRRMMIDRMRVYGERLAVVTSALMFGLFHGNLSQFFYAFLLGLVFGYVYLRKGKLRYTAALHMFVNLIGSVPGSLLMKYVDEDTLDALQGAADPEQLRELLSVPGVAAYYVFVLLIVALGITGLVLLCVNAKRVHFEPAPQELPKGSRFSTVWLNLGMILLVLGCLGLFAASMLGM